MLVIAVTLGMPSRVASVDMYFIFAYVDISQRLPPQYRVMYLVAGPQASLREHLSNREARKRTL